MSSITTLPAASSDGIWTLNADEIDAVGGAKVETKVYSLPFGVEYVTWGNGTVSCWMLWDGEKRYGGGCST